MHREGEVELGRVHEGGKYDQNNYAKLYIQEPIRHLLGFS